MAGQAFEGPRLNGFKLTPDEFVIIGLDTDDGEEHPLYDPRIRLPVPEGLVRSIMARGVIKPVFVRKEDGRPEVIDGRQRIRAAREADKRLKEMGEPGIRVPTLLEKDEEEKLMLLAVATNEFNVEDDPLLKARKAKKLVDRGLTEEEIANAYGVSKKSIQNWLRLLELAPPVKKAVETGKVSASTAAQLKNLPADEQKEALKDLTSKGNGKKPTAKQARAVARAKTGEAADTAPSKKVLRFIVEKHEEHKLSDDFVRGVAFAIGRLDDPSTINGLKAALTAARKAPARKRSSAHS